MLEFEEFEIEDELEFVWFNDCAGSVWLLRSEDLESWDELVAVWFYESNDDCYAGIEELEF